MYRISEWTRFSEKDFWECGCDPDSGFLHVGDDLDIQGEDLKGLLTEATSYFGATLNDLYVDEDNPEIVKFCVLEDDDGFKATEEKIARWQSGAIPFLWRSEYELTVQEGAWKPVSFQTALPELFRPQSGSPG